MAFLRDFKKRLCRSTSGNATLMVALGMPALIGGTGFAVDTAQWYMWKREMQFAADQAAVAGAWARAVEDTEDTYDVRAIQEFNANVQQTGEFVGTPEVTLANYAGGVQNSVAVTVTASRTLPFSSFLTGKGVTIRAYAQAKFEDGTTYTSCLVAVDEEADGAITIGGSTVLTAQCGLAALSKSDEAVTVNGSPTIDAGWVLAAGGIDDWFDENTDDTILEYVDGLEDPFAELSPPNPAESQVNRTYNCVRSRATTTADIISTLNVSYSYYKGSGRTSASPTGWATPKSGYTSNSSQDDVVVPEGTTAGAVTTTNSNWDKLTGTGNNTIWEVETREETKTYSDINVSGGGNAAAVVPGTYTDLKVRCDTTFATGVYILDGGELEINGQYQVTGSNVMFVLKNGAGLKINGGANINLTAIQASDLTARGVPREQANKLAGMLIFEDRNSEGNSGNMINGNAATVLNGAVYLPVSNISMSGTASVTSQCLMIAASTITMTGNLDMSTFCPPGMSEDTIVGVTKPNVRLVA
ncbi:pilus assembly protein TadG-related protein [Altererythrobacter litoralis]|uniref:Pilus assembly protein TadG-related protein n=1 Tax=Altererythrobacter litoralis TaxID=3113904 RepID=A0ABU7GBY8_9SPHN|nr:pilus assembly protein TadG-related protein [Erythrobacteraceae bacterium 1XM1-14]